MVTDGMLLAAAHALASTVSDDLLARSQIFPSVTSVQDVSLVVARAVARSAIDEGIADPLDDVEAAIEADRWFPDYVPYRAA